MQFLYKDIDLSDADIQNYRVYSICLVQPLITEQAKQHRTYIKKNDIKYMLLSIRGKMHIRNTVDAIKIPPPKKNPKTFAFGVPFKMQGSTRSTSEQHNQSELQSIFMGQFCQEQALYPPVVLA